MNFQFPNPPLAVPMVAIIMAVYAEPKRVLASMQVENRLSPTHRMAIECLQRAGMLNANDEPTEKLRDYVEALTRVTP